MTACSSSVAEETNYAEEVDATPTEQATGLISLANRSTDSRRYDILLSWGDPKRGAILFDTFQDATGFACSTCHNTDSASQKVGPGLLNIGSHAAVRTGGQSASHYLFDSIVEPDIYVVEGFDDGVMPTNWAEVYNLTDIGDIMAYLMTLEGDEIPPETQVAQRPTTNVEAVILPGSADPVHGEALFNTFQPAADFSCANCHLTATENQLIGPGLLDIGSRAATRVEGMDAVTYIYKSIVDPDAYVVEDFSDELMPQNWAEIYSDEDILNIIAYLLTLEG